MITGEEATIGADRRYQGEDRATQGGRSHDDGGRQAHRPDREVGTGPTPSSRDRSRGLADGGVDAGEAGAEERSLLGGSSRRGERLPTGRSWQQPPPRPRTDRSDGPRSCRWRRFGHDELPRDRHEDGKGRRRCQPWRGWGSAPHRRRRTPTLSVFDRTGQRGPPPVPGGFGGHFRHGRASPGREAGRCPR